MKIKFRGLYVTLRKSEEFEFEHPDETSTNLDAFYFTFESIYYLNELTNIPLILEISNEEKSFKQLDEKIFDQSNNKLLSVCGSTNFLWCLIIRNDEKNNGLCLLKYASCQLIETFPIPDVANFNDLKLIATDVNVYLFENSEATGLKCVYELIKRSDINKKLLEKEFNLNEDSISSMPLNKILIHERIEQFFHGKEHLLMLTSKTKQIYSFGIGTKGQLGTSNIENCFMPILIEGLRGQKILSLPSHGSGLGWHSGCLTQKGECFMWGWNCHEQLGVDQDEINSACCVSPIKLNIFNESECVKFKRLSLGANHSCLIDSDNYLYSFGWNKYSQLFLNKESCKYEQIEIAKRSADCLNEENTLTEENLEKIEEPLKFTDFKVLDVKCGFWSTLVLKTK
jgi:hypothetical protein